MLLPALRRFIVALSLLATSPGYAAEPAVPSFWDANERLSAPTLGDLPRLRFLTTIDFPPFSYLDSSGRISGFHVDLARALCAALDILPKCEIQGVPWDELQPTLARGDAEAIIAGIPSTAENRTRYAFTRSYLQFPGRFIMQRSAALAEPIYGKLADRRIGVMAGSAHERLLRDYFPNTRPVTYSNAEWLFGDLRAGKIEAAFGDGMRLAFWLGGSGSEGCCRFAGGPYLAPEYLGNGLSIAVAPDRLDLVAALNFALREVNAKGQFAELYLRHFPVSFY